VPGPGHAGGHAGFGGLAGPAWHSGAALAGFETLAGIKAVIFDKTGTLTHDRLEVRDIRTRQGADERQALALARQLAEGSLHPVSRALVQAAGPG
jgi:cation transport ATPase